MSVALLDYLQRQPGLIYKRLYQQPSTVLAILRRMLPHLGSLQTGCTKFRQALIPRHSKEYRHGHVVHVTAVSRRRPEYLDTTRSSSVGLIVTTTGRFIANQQGRQRDEAMTILEQLHILTLVPEPPVPRAYKMHPSFANSLRQALMGGGSTQSFGVPITGKMTPRVSMEELDAWARGQWESILYYMVGSTAAGLNAGKKITKSIRTLLELGEFVLLRGDRAVITKDGFTFLLQEANAQVWSLLIVYLDNGENLKMDSVDMLSFLFMLGSLTLGQDYSSEHLSATQRLMLQDLHDFGIVYEPPESPGRFYPTRLATTLTSADSSALPNDSKSSLSVQPGKGYVILETNHRVYAYTNSPLQIAVLNLFVKLSNRYPNLVSGKLTKDSIQRAISYGITSDQIISYLAHHAHPQMHKSTPILPPTVVDQIRLWQIEGDRMKATEGFLLRDFANTQEYNDCVQYADNLGVLIWRSDKTQKFFVSKIEQMKTYLSRKKV